MSFLHRHHDSIEDGEDWFSRKQGSDKQILALIGEKTDPIADEALRQLDQLPAAERELFIRGLLRQVVVQTLHTNRILDEEHATLGGEYASVIDHFGDGLAGVELCAGATRLRQTVIRDSLPTFVQPQLITD